MFLQNHRFKLFFRLNLTCNCVFSPQTAEDLHSSDDGANVRTYITINYHKSHVIKGYK